MDGPRATSVARRPWALALLLFAVTLALYWRTGGFAFLNYDDDVYVTDNPAVRGGLSLDGLRWALTSGYAANWHPLTWLSHQLDVELFRMDAGGHHRTSAWLHALNAALAFAALRALTGATGKSALVAAFFALHPLRAESVAWVAERKDVLSAAFALASLWAYARFARSASRRAWAASLALFALGLMAKPMLVTLPCLMLLVDFWPLGRTGRATDGASVPARRPALEKAPFFALAAASSVATFLVQRAAGATPPLVLLGVSARIATAFEAYTFYLAKSLWPTRLCALYPHTLIGSSAGAWTMAALASLALVLAVTSVAWLLRRRAPAVLVGWLWFLGTLVPVVGFVQVGLQSWADRYTYLPSIGLGIALVWGCDALVRGAARHALVPAALLGLAALLVASARQIETWRDSRTVFERALSVTEDNVAAHVNLGESLEQAGDLAGAEEHYRSALALRPTLAPVHVSLARVLEHTGRAAEARAELDRALALEPGAPDAHAALGWLLAQQGSDAEALPHLRAAVEAAPDQLPLRNNLAWVLATSAAHAAPEEALDAAQALCRATGHAQPGFLETLAAALARLGRFDEAVRWQERAIEGVPADAKPALRKRLELYRAGRPYVRG